LKSGSRYHSDSMYSDPVDEEVDITRLRLQKLLKKQEPIESYFDRLNVNPHGRKYGKNGPSFYFVSCLCL
jgi:hypothetical protein